MKEIKPEYAKWRNRVEGQIQHTINEHPEWFNLPDKEIKDRCVRSMAKRIIGEIVAGSSSSDNTMGNVQSLVRPIVRNGLELNADSSEMGSARTSATHFNPTKEQS